MVSNMKIKLQEKVKEIIVAGTEAAGIITLPKIIQFEVRNSTQAFQYQTVPTFASFFPPFSTPPQSSLRFSTLIWILVGIQVFYEPHTVGLQEPLFSLVYNRQ